MISLLGRVEERMRENGELPPLVEPTLIPRTKEVSPSVESLSFSNPIYSIEETWTGPHRFVTGATQLRFKNHDQVLAPDYPSDWIMAVGDNPGDMKLYEKPSEEDKIEAGRRLRRNRTPAPDNAIFARLINQSELVDKIGPSSKIFSAKKLQEFASDKQNVETDLGILLAKSVLNLDEIAQLQDKARANTK